MLCVFLFSISFIFLSFLPILLFEWEKITVEAHTERHLNTFTQWTGFDVKANAHIPDPNTSVEWKSLCQPHSHTHTSAHMDRTPKWSSLLSFICARCRIENNFVNSFELERVFVHMCVCVPYQICRMKRNLLGQKRMAKDRNFTTTNNARNTKYRSGSKK